MNYVDGFVAAVPTVNREAYRKHAEAAAAVFREHGVLFGQVKAGRQATVVPQGPGGRYGAVVKMVDKVVDAASGTFVARLELPNPQQAVPGGARCTAEIDGVAPLPPGRAKP